MAKKKKSSCYVVDDDPIVLETMAGLLKGAGYTVTTNTESTDAVNDIAKKKPDFVISRRRVAGRMTRSR